MRQHRAILISIAIPAVLALPAAAQAAPGPAIPSPTIQEQFTIVKAPGSFSWALAGMTDLDQVRGTDQATGKQGLPGDGKMFCVPTSLTNVLVYLRERGWNGPNWPAAIDYVAADNYNAGTDAIKAVGAPMGTTTAGTSGNGYYAGLEAFLPDASRSGMQAALIGQSTFISYDDVSSPSPREMAAAGAAGGLVLGHISFYKDVTYAGQTVKQWSGGHEFTVTGASAGGVLDPVTLRTRDPASPWVVDTVQSAYADDSHTLTPRSLKFLDGNTIKTKSVWVYDNDTNVIFDGYTVISPQVAYTLPKINKILWSRIPLLPGPDPVISQQFSTPGDRAVVDIATTAHGQGLFFLLKGSSAVWRLDPITGETKAIAKVAGARSLVVGGRSQDVFVAGATTIARIDGRIGRTLGTSNPPEPVRELAFDARRNTLLALSTSGKTLRSYSSRLAVGPVKSLGSTAPRFLATDARGQVLIAGARQITASRRAGGASAAGATARASARVPFSATTKSPIRGVGVFDDGTLAVSRGGKLVLVDTAGKSVASPLSGLASVGPIATSLRFNGFTSRSQIKSLDFVSDQLGPLLPPPAG